MNISIRGSIVASIPACHAGDLGSIPGRGVFLLPAHSLAQVTVYLRAGQHLRIRGLEARLCEPPRGPEPTQTLPGSKALPTSR